MRYPATRLALQFVLLLAAMAVAPTLHAQQQTGFAYLSVCNKGTVTINVATATEDALSITEMWDIFSWTAISPGACQQVYRDNGNQGVPGLTAYIGFGFYDSHKKFVAATVDRVPDFGYNEYNLVYALAHGSKGRNVLMKGDANFCVKDSGVSYKIKSLIRDCANLSVPGSSAGGFFSFPAAFSFKPVVSVLCCGDHATWSGGVYVLNVAPGPSDANLHASVGSSSNASGSSPNASTGDAGPDWGAMLKAAAAAAAEERRQGEAIRAADAVQARAQAQAAVKQNICLSDDLTTEWRNPPPGGKMDKLKRQLIASLRDRAAHPGGYDQTKWFAVDSTYYPGWDPDTYFKGVVSSQPPGSCSAGKHLEILPLTP